MHKFAGSAITQGLNVGRIGPLSKWLQRPRILSFLDRTTHKFAGSAITQGPNVGRIGPFSKWLQRPRILSFLDRTTHKFAGSAIAQGPNVGRIDRWSKWGPTSAEPLWLLLSGAMDPPKNINISKRRTWDTSGDRSGRFLAGVTRDLVNMEDVVRAKLFNTVKDLYLTKSSAVGHIRRFFDACKSQGAKPMLYYTGHGEIGTGNWSFADGTISIQELFNMVPEGCYYPMIFSDACYSGHWANFCASKGIAGFHCLAACPEYSTAVDTKGELENPEILLISFYLTNKGALTVFCSVKARRKRR